MTLLFGPDMFQCFEVTKDSFIVIDNCYIFVQTLFVQDPCFVLYE